jgi:hypothetical protein
MTTKTIRPALLVALLALPACGGGSSTPDPIAPTPAPTAAPTPAPTATPAPAPLPTPCDDCEPAVDSNTPASRLTIRLYILTNEKGKQIRNYDPEKIPVGWHLTLDAVAKDAENRETNGEKVLRWFVDNPGIVEQGGNHPHQTKLTPTEEGQVEVYGKQDGATSNVLKFVFVAAAE